MKGGCFVLGATPGPDESLPGFMLRLGKRVGVPNAARLAAMAGLRQPGCATSSGGFQALGKLAGIDSTVLAAMAYPPVREVSSRHRFCDGMLDREIIDLSRRRSCPRCLQVDLRHRQEWDVTLLTACPAHAVRLNLRCPKCGCSPGWTHTDLAACACGSDLRLWPAQAVAIEEVTASLRLLSLARKSDLSWLPSALLACDPADLVHLAMCMGMFLTGWSRLRHVETLSAAGPAAVASVMVGGIDALARWPLPLREYLADMRLEAGKRTGRYGARKAVGMIYPWLQGLAEGPVREAVLAVARELPAGDPLLAREVHRSSLIPPPAQGPQHVMGLVETARMLGRSQATVKRMISGGVLPNVESRGRGVPMAINGAIVAALAAAQAGTLDLKQARSLLGVSKARVRRLLAGGALEGAKLASGMWAIPEASVTALLDRLHVEAAAPGSRRNMVSFNSTAEAARQHGLNICQFVDSISDGRLRPRGSGGNGQGLGRLQFDRADVRDFCQCIGHQGPFSLQAVAELLAYKWEVVSHLVKVGLIEALNNVVSAAALERFQADIVSGADLAREAGTSPRMLARQLALRGVFPVSGPTVDAGRQNFFRRKDVS